MLLDTSGLLCYFDRGDARHFHSLSLFKAARTKLTHSYILAEFVALTQARPLDRKTSLDFVDAIVVHPDIDVVWVNHTIHESGMRLLRKQLDKTYSLCDAVSLALMQQRHITEAFSTDHHFNQAGFRALLSVAVANK